MKSTKGDRVLCLPGEEKWELWAASEAGNLRHDAEDVVSSPNEFRDVTHFAFPVSRVTASPFWVVSEDDSLIPDMVSMRLETLGIPQSTGLGVNADYTLANQEENRRLVLASSFSNMAGLELPKGDAEHFEISPNLYPMPRNHLVLWQELGRWVMAVSREGRVVYYQMLTARELDAAAVLELKCLLLQLHSQGVISELAGVVVWNSQALPESASAALQRGLEMPVYSEAKPAPLLPEELLDLLPDEVAENREAAIRRKKLRSRLLLGALAYMLLLGGVILFWWFQKQKVDKVAQEVEELRPEVSWIMPTQQRWNAVQPALDGDLYPLELMRRCTEVLPNSGVRFKQIDLSANGVFIQGEASRAGDAIRYQSKLKKALDDFRLETPPPRIDPRTKTATFTVKGKRDNGEA